MPLMNHTAFPDKVESGEKRTSIRAKRRQGEFKPNNPIYHYRGLRTKACRKISDAVCTAVTDIKIMAVGAVELDGETLSKADAEIIAKNDGFESLGAFYDYFTLGRRKRKRKTFCGNLIEWKPLKELWK